MSDADSEIRTAVVQIQVEPLDRWPRHYTCVHNWCPAKSAECERCDMIVRHLRRQWQPTEDEE